jgi:hypothetical protein
MIQANGAAKWLFPLCPPKNTRVENSAPTVESWPSRLRYVPQGIPRILVLHADEDVYRGAEPYGDFAGHVIVLSTRMAEAIAAYFPSPKTNIQ